MIDWRIIIDVFSLIIGYNKWLAGIKSLSHYLKNMNVGGGGVKHILLKLLCVSLLLLY